MSDDTTFSMIISSDPQYPWYADVGLVPSPEGMSDENKARLAEQRIRAQYNSMNDLFERAKGTQYEIRGVFINGDLTNTGQDGSASKYENQFSKYQEFVSILKMKYYPSLGNHDYANNINAAFGNNDPARMVDYMSQWLTDNGVSCNNFVENAPVYLNTSMSYTGSLAYSFNIGAVHFIQLQNYPFFSREWSTLSRIISSEFHGYEITNSISWFENDLRMAQNRCDAIIVLLHDYYQSADGLKDDGTDARGDYVGHRDFAADTKQFQSMVKQYGVSAIFTGHIHPSCELIDEIPAIDDSYKIPVFRSGAACFEDYLVADIDVSQKTIVVRKMESNNGQYGFTSDKWQYPLHRRELQGVPLDVLVHLEGIGDETYTHDQFAGTRGQGKRLEGFQITFDPPIPGLGMSYMAHLEGSGDTPYVNDGNFVGTRGEGRRLEGFAIKLTGENALRYYITYMAHLEGSGDTPYLGSGEFCGTRGESRGVEGIQVIIRRWSDSLLW